MSLNTYTVFCQEADGSGTIWVSAVQARDLAHAKDVGRRECREDWRFDPDSSADPDDPEYAPDVHVLGVAEGAVNLMFWEDIAQ